MSGDSGTLSASSSEPNVPAGMPPELARGIPRAREAERALSTVTEPLAHANSACTTTDAARMSFQRGPAFSRGADQGSWDSVVEGCRETVGVVDPQVVGLSGENSCSMLGDWLASWCQERAAEER